MTGRRTWPERLFTNSDRTGGPNACWPWLAAKDDRGYGLTTTADRKTRRAHRVVYEYEVGPISDGLTLDHLCRNVSCVNPAHLEPVTAAENKTRGAYRFVGVCRKGHDVSKPGALKTEAGGKRQRCRECSNEYRRQWLAKRAAGA